MANPRTKQVLAKILTRYVRQASVHTTLDAVLPLDITGDAREHFIENLRPDALNELPLQMEALTEELAARDLINVFIQTLLRSRAMDIRLQGIFNGTISINDSGDIDQAHLQSLESRVSPFLNAKTFGDFMASTPRRVCAIWIKRPGAREGEFKGTGFLIAPDLVMTAHHVLDKALTAAGDKELDGAVVKCVFDYWANIYPRDVETPNGSELIVADTPQKWLEWHSLRHPSDGRSHEFPYPPDVYDRLDCAIIRLSRPIGAEALAAGGGRLRGWIKLPDAVEQMTTDDPVAILQHPNGGPQGLDKGKFVRADASDTRIWYTAEASGGSSGSPCFDRETGIVGFHNAGRPPAAYTGATKECNQGIHIAQVVNALPRKLKDASRDGTIGESALWSLADRGDRPIPVLGRKDFQTAVLKLFVPKAEKRIIVVEEASEAAATGKSGKTFSAGILKAIARDRPAMVLDFPASELARFSPEEFIFELGRRIGIDAKQFETMPPKPNGERQLARWLSTELPDWFGQLIEHRAISAVVAALERQGDAGAAAGQANGAAAGQNGDASTRQRDAAPATGRELVIKELIWIVIDDIHKTPPERGMKELLAGMAGVTDTQPVLRPGLKALRWLMIGHAPDFVRDRVNEYIPDIVSPSAIGKAEWVDWLRAYFVSSGQADRFDKATAQALYDFSVSMLPGASDPRSRLTSIAGAAAQAILSLQPPAGGA